MAQRLDHGSRGTRGHHCHACMGVWWWVGPGTGGWGHTTECAHWPLLLLEPKGGVTGIEGE